MVYSDTIPGYGGLPLGTNGRAMSLLSGGIDSPVAYGWLQKEENSKIEVIHFHSYPFTSEKSQDKVKDIQQYIS